MNLRTITAIFFLVLSGCQSPVAYIPPDQVAADPEFSLASGIYTTEQSLSITSKSSGVKIYYTFDGSVPSSSSALYTGPIVLTDRGFSYNVRAIALKSDLRPSGITSANLEIVLPNLAALSVTPAPGTYGEDQTIQANCSTPGVYYYYTEDGSNPTIQSPLFAGLDITGNGTTKTLKIMAYKPGFRPTFYAGNYTINYAQVSQPTFFPLAGTHTSDIAALTISVSPSDATIYYTDDGSDPISSPTRQIYVSSLSLDGHGSVLNLKAAAVKSGMNNSSVNSGAYSIEYNSLSPVNYSHPAGTYDSGIPLVLSSTEPGTSIYYTDTGIDPSINSQLFSGPININGNGTIKEIRAVAYKSGFLPSAVLSKSFTISFGTVSVPLASKLPGIYTSDFTLSLSGSVGASIFWARDDLNTVPDESLTWTPYTGPISFSGDGSKYLFKAYSTKVGMLDSTVFSDNYEVNYPDLSAVNFSPPPGTYSTAQDISLSSTDSGDIHYTVDGSEPTVLSPIYSAPILVAGIGKTKSIRTMVTKPGYSNSPLVSGNYTITLSTKTLNTIAGSGLYGLNESLGTTQVQLQSPQAVVKDALGNLYIADTNNHRVRKVTAGGVVTTIAGTGVQGYNGDSISATSAQLNFPYGISLGAAAGELFIADSGNHRIRRISAGTITTVAGTGSPGFSGDGGLGVLASFNEPRALFRQGTKLYIADTMNHSIRVLDLSSPFFINRIIGDGIFGSPVEGDLGTASRLKFPQGLFHDGTRLFISDTQNQQIWSLETDNTMAHVAGIGTQGFSGDSGLATGAQLSEPMGIWVSGSGYLYFSDKGNHRVRSIKLSNGSIDTIIGDGTAAFSGDGLLGTLSRVSMPTGLFGQYNSLSGKDTLYLADTDNHRIRSLSEISIMSTSVGIGYYSFSGDAGFATDSQLFLGSYITVASDGTIYISDTGNYRIRKISGGVIITVVGNGTPGTTADGETGLLTSVVPAGLAVNGLGELIFADQGSHRIRKLGTDNLVVTLVGTGTAGESASGQSGTISKINAPTGIYLKGSELYFSDSGNHRIKKLNSLGEIDFLAGTGPLNSGFAGDGGQATSAKINTPQGLALDSTNRLIFADYGNNRVRRVNLDGTTETIAGDGTTSNFTTGALALATSLGKPMGIALDEYDRVIFSEGDRQRIRIIDEEGYLTDWAGKGMFGFSVDGTEALSAFLGFLSGIFYQSGKLIYFDQSFQMIRAFQ